MIGRRVKTIEEIERPGDYCGAIMGYTGDKPAVFYMLPIPKEELVNAGIQRAVHHVVSPPHQFRECADGSLEIRESILTRQSHAEPNKSWSWHGYLDEGHVWRTV